jgi:integrase
MRRKGPPTIKYYPSRKAYYTKLDGVQHWLATGPKDEPDGPTFKKAQRAFATMVLGKDGERPDPTVDAVIALYIAHVETLVRDRQRTAETQRSARRFLLSAARCLGSLKTSALTPALIRGWLNAQRAWNVSTRSTALKRLSAAYAFAVSEGTAEANPIQRVTDRPQPRKRSAETILDDDQADALLAAVTPQLGHLLAFLRLTGCRPSEAIHAQVKHYRPDVPAVVHTANVPQGEWVWKCARTGRDRVILLTPDADAIVRDAIGGRAEGYVFLNGRGRRWTVNGIGRMLGQVRKRPAVRAALRAPGRPDAAAFMYCFRHTWITRMLEDGAAIKDVADWAGTSVKYVHENYGHGHENVAGLAARFNAMMAARKRQANG